MPLGSILLRRITAQASRERLDPFVNKSRWAAQVRSAMSGDQERCQWVRMSPSNAQGARMWPPRTQVHQLLLRVRVVFAIVLEALAGWLTSHARDARSSASVCGARAIEAPPATPVAARRA